MWKGTAETLNPSPTTRSRAPTTNSGFPSIGESLITAVIFWRLVVPVAP